ncbi:hypothetical protein U0070_013717, partial [Myodes glareolus]
MDTFSTKSLALQAQKKVLSKMASKAMVAVFADDTSSEILDELYQATKEFTRSRKEAQRVVKNLVKVAVKLAVLLRAGQLDGDELAQLRRFQGRVRSLAMTALSFHQVDFTFDRRVLAAGLLECRDLLHQATGPHLTAKSHGRINHVFSHFANGDFLAALYGPAEPYRSHLRRICDGLGRMLDEGVSYPITRTSLSAPKAGWTGWDASLSITFPWGSQPSCQLWAGRGQVLEASLSHHTSSTGPGPDETLMLTRWTKEGNGLRFAGEMKRKARAHEGHSFI